MIRLNFASQNTIINLCDIQINCKLVELCQSTGCSNDRNYDPLTSTSLFCS